MFNQTGCAFLKLSGAEKDEEHALLFFLPLWKGTSMVWSNLQPSAALERHETLAAAHFAPCLRAVLQLCRAQYCREQPETLTSSSPSLCPSHCTPLAAPGSHPSRSAEQCILTSQFRSVHRQGSLSVRHPSLKNLSGERSEAKSDVNTVISAVVCPPGSY